MEELTAHRLPITFKAFKMKANLLKLYMACVMLITLYTACNKKELASPDQGKVVKLTIVGNSTEQLEFIYRNEVIAAPKDPGQIVINALLSVNGQDEELKIRKKGTTEILQSKKITNTPYAQNINIYYDGTKIYENAIILLLKGYAISGELEFLIDGKLSVEGSAQIEKSLTLLMDNNGTRELTIRKKGETAILFTKTIGATPALQPLVFFFDGTNIVGNVQLDPPADPKNMMIKARFQTTFPNQFKNVDVDLVFYTRLLLSSNASVGTKITPEIRFTLPKDGSFNTIELPPLPGPEYIYSFDIYEKGTNIEPYNPGVPLTLTGYTIKPNEGRVTSAYVDFPENRLNFQAGKSKLLIITDSRTLAVVAGTRSVFISGGKVNDLSKYFQ